MERQSQFVINKWRNYASMPENSESRAILSPGKGAMFHKMSQNT